MSSEGYTGYTLSPAERARLERERQRQLEEERRRQEVEARREAERLRQELVAAQKQRVQWAADFQPNRFPADDRPLERTPTQSLGVSPGRVVRTDDDRASQRHKTETQLLRLKTRLEVFPDAWRTACREELTRLYRLAELAEKERQTNFVYHYESLRRAEQEVLGLVTAATKRLAERDRMLETGQVGIERMMATLQVIRRLSPRDDDGHRAESLLRRLKGVYALPNPEEVKRQLAALETEVEELRGPFEDLQRREQERQRVLGLLRETLAGMGYEPLELNSDRKPPVGSSIRLAFKTPDHEVLQTDLDLNRALHFSFKHAADRPDNDAASVSRDELVARARRWCKDYEAIKHRWRLEGIELDDKWLQAPEEGQIESIVLGSVDAPLTDEERRLLGSPADKGRVIE
jgi:hypothetical protein